MKRWRDLWHRYHAWIGATVSGILLLICYGFVLRLPFFLDDLPIMTWLSRHSWADIWARSSENQFYRPLAFTIYKLGRMLPRGTDHTVLHGVSLLTHWASSIIVTQIIKLYDRSLGEAVLGSILFAVFPFTFMAVPWITAMSHPLVTLLTLLAVLAALKGEQDEALGWWGLSFLATTLAPLAHESGQICAAIVGGIVLIQHGLRSRRRIALVALGGALNVGTMILRSYIPGVGEATFTGLKDAWFPNTMFFLHGLTYPVASIIGRLVHHYGAHDFTLVAIAAAGLLITLAWLARRDRKWRWIACSLWWWACAAVPAGASLGYEYLYTSPRVYALAVPGTVMLWAGVIVTSGQAVQRAWGRWTIWTLVIGLIVTQNVTFLRRRRGLFNALNGIYQRVLDVAKTKRNAPLGFVNLPKSLAYQEKTYAMILETVLFIPPYSNVAEFIEVNSQWRPADAVTYSPVLQETEYAFGFQGEGIDWEGMRQFAIEHRTVWLTQWHDGEYFLNHVGRIEVNVTPSPERPLARFEGGPVIESASAEQAADGHWAVAIDWLASGPVDGKIFVHVRDANGEMAAQADGPALGGMIPPWLWRAGDRIHDVRHFSPQGPPPYTVQVGLFTSEGRFPAFVGDIRYRDDAVPVATLEPRP